MLRASLRILALVLSCLHALGLLVLGAQLPADDLIFGDLGPLLVLLSLCLFGLAALAWFAPTLGGTLLMVVAGIAMAFGAALTIQAALVFGAPSFVAGVLFVGTAAQAEVEAPALGSDS